MKKIKTKEPGKIRKCYEMFKLIWANKQYKSVIKLTLYFIFIGGVLIFLQLSSPKQSPSSKKSLLETYAISNNYAYKYTLTNNSEITIVEGIRYNNQESFIINNKINKYLLDNNSIYSLLETGNIKVLNPVSYNLISVKPDNIYKMISKGKVIANTTYWDGIHEKTYEISMHDFSILYSGTEEISPNNIIIKVQTNGKNVVKVILDMTNYFKLKNNAIINYVLVLDYYNINQVEPI